MEVGIGDLRRRVTAGAQAPRPRGQQADIACRTHKIAAAQGQFGRAAPVRGFGRYPHEVMHEYVTCTANNRGI